MAGPLSIWLCVQLTSALALRLRRAAAASLLILLSQKVAAAGGFALVADLLGCCFVIRERPAMPDWTAESEAAFDAYVDALIGVIGHADRAEPLKDYCLGLLMPIERKSVEPLAAVMPRHAADRRAPTRDGWALH
jgi:hypothetical protein